jgi:hypothetical protein
MADRKLTVVVSEYGEEIESFPCKNPLESPVHLSFHIWCGSNVSVIPISTSFNAIYCSNCHMRLPIPQSIRTIAQLRNHFHKFNQGKSSVQ